MTAIKTKDRERSIQESRYLVSFMKPRATDAAMICSTIEIIRAINLTILTYRYFLAKIKVI
jgi:hypothetical protein